MRKPCRCNSSARLRVLLQVQSKADSGSPRVVGATNPSNQPGIPTGNNESQIRSVNVFLGARSTYLMHQARKAVYARNNLVTQISLRSMAYRDRYN